MESHLFMEDLGRRHPARRPVFESGNLSPIVFLTVCTRRRQPILAAPDIHDLLVSIWKQADGWLVGRFVILPDHLHLFCSPNGPSAPPLHAWITFWKSLCSRRWPRPGEHPVWQVDAWDTQMRRGENYSAKWDYVRENPVRHGLVTSAEDWPYQGELNVLTWHDR